MKKYKLIKEYPGSPKLDTIIIHKDNSWIDPYPSVEHDQMILIDWVIKYPQYWEEITEKDYEILSFKCNNNIWQLKNNKYYYNHMIYDLDYMLECITAVCNPTIIHSIKRLSDGE